MAQRPEWDEEGNVSKLLREAGKLLGDYANIEPEKMEGHVKYIVSVPIILPSSKSI